MRKGEIESTPIWTNHWHARARKQEKEEVQSPGLRGWCTIREMHGEKGVLLSFSHSRLREREGSCGEMSLQKFKKNVSKRKILGVGCKS